MVDSLYAMTYTTSSHVFPKANATTPRVLSIWYMSYFAEQLVCKNSLMPAAYKADKIPQDTSYD